MVCVRQGTERSLALSPRHCLRGFAFCTGAAAREQQAMGSGDEPPATASATSSLVPATASHAASQSGCSQQGLSFGKEGFGDQACCLESRANPTRKAARELPPGTKAREMASNQTPFRSPALGTVGDWKALFF